MEHETDSNNQQPSLQDLAARLTLVEHAVAALVGKSQTHTHTKPVERIDFGDLGGKYVGYTCDGCGRFVAAAPEESVEKKDGSPRVAA
jgi:hypothetical protein